MMVKYVGSRQPSGLLLKLGQLLSYMVSARLLCLKFFNILNKHDTTFGLVAKFCW